MNVVLLLCLCAVTVVSEKCYTGYGCFHTFGSFKALPQEPDVIKTAFELFSKHGNSVLLATDSSHWRSLLSAGHFSASKETKFIIHGFSNSGHTSWVTEMKNDLLQKGDFNVIVVDWGKGSSFPYTQATANTFLVAAEVAKFVKYLHSSLHVDLKKVHLIGHSLGAQICGNVGAAVRGIRRISGLDPAEPYFINFPDSNRLDKSDASFVDVIHTDGEKFSGIAGYGMMKACGDIDFYPNGGEDQPGCSDNPLGSLLGGIFGGHAGQATKSVSCSHGRAIKYFIESLKSSTCKFTGHTCRDWASYETGTCHGCPSGGCPVMGYDADQTSDRGSFYLSTGQTDPFCGHEFFVEIDLASVDENAFGRLYVTLTGSKGTSAEVEFTRENRHYHKSDHEKHMIAIHKDIGSVSSVKVKFDKGDGLAGSGTDTEVIVSRVFVRDANTSNQVKFCGHNAHILDDKSISLTSHSGC
ncbi:pancreatic triacylglycerol lipase-like [Haliotis rufescens]|uniref:pancreatic triacylglycerol lipase-like n=1 Tax=Haliotis rufescens TaxID=6454 RepID=UPI00201E7B74|nr:pancreatic triacylglycerol lipase-like [Haliotis rufescens]